MEPSLAAALLVASVLTSTGDPRALARQGEVTWIGTTGGLVRIEGDQARVLGTAEGLPDSTVRALFVGGEGVLWVGTDRGLARIEGRRVRAIATDAPVTAITRDGTQLVIGTHRGVARIEGERAIAIEGAPALVTDVALHGGVLYASSHRGGVQRWDGTRWMRLRGDDLAWDLEVDGSELRVASSAGPAIVAGDRVRPIRTTLPVADVRVLRRVGGSLIAGTCGAGAFVLRGRRAEPVPGTSGCVRAIEGTTIATDRGVTRDGVPVAMPEGLPDPDISSLARNGEGLWVGTFRSGLARIAADGTITRYDERGGLLDDRINRLAVDGEGDLWIATDRGLVERERGRFVLRGLLDRHVVLVAWTGDRILAASGEDVHAWDPTSATLTALAIGRRAQDVARTSTGAIATATAEGLVIDDHGVRRTLTSDEGGLPDDWATALAEHEGALAIGTYNAGITLFDGERAHTLRDDLWVNPGALTSARLGGRAVLAAGALEDGLHLWDGTTWSRLGVREGLPDDDVTAIVADPDGSLWIATRGGIAHLIAR